MPKSFSTDISSIIIPALSIILTLYIGMKTLYAPLKVDACKKQLYNVYLPLFTFIEPYLYTLPSTEVLEEFITLFESIKSSHYELIPSDLLLIIDRLTMGLKNNTYGSGNYEYLCLHIDSNFEKLRKYLSLPTRTFSYKYRYKQFHSEKLTVLRSLFDLLGKALLLIILFFLIITFLYAVSALLA